MVDGIDLLFSPSDSSSLVYRSAIDFCNITEFVYSNSFFVESLGFSISNLMSSANSDSFTSSYPIGIPFITLSCLAALARTSKIVLNKSGASGHSCLVPDIRGKDFSFSPLSMMLAVGLSYMAFIMLWCIPSVPTLLQILNQLASLE